MPVGNNGGGNLNLLMFELGMISRDPLGILPPIVSTLSVHPMVVVPSSIRYSDRSRSTITETHGGSIVTKGGRAPRSVTCEGTFGVESRGLGIWIGTGNLRMEKFWHEVIRLSDAVTKGQVDAEKDIFRSPILSLLLKTYDEERCTFFVNYYDFWHDVQFEAHMESFDFSKSNPGGSASGMSRYNLQFAEAGPIVTGSLGTTIINGLFQALTAWDSINELIKSYTPDAIVGSLVDTAGILVGQFNESKAAVEAWIDGAAAVVNGFEAPQPSTVESTSSGGSSTPRASAGGSKGLPDVEAARTQTGLSGHLTRSAQLASAGAALLDALRSQAPAAGESPGGEIEWGAVTGEGEIPSITAADQQDQLTAVVDAARFQGAVGALYGMSRAEYAAFLSAAGLSGRDPALSGTITHVVTDTDSIDTIQRAYAVPIDVILRLNELSPDEALLVGTRLEIPRARPVGQQVAIAGLPVFGSHAGRAAWGRDLWTDLRTNGAGRLAVCEGPDILEQGVAWIVQQFEPELLRFANETPPGFRELAIAKRVGALLASDQRVSSVDRVNVTVTPDGGMSVEASVVAINGETISTGRAA